MYILPTPTVCARGHSSAHHRSRRDKIGRDTFIVAFPSPQLLQDSRRANMAVVWQFRVIIYVDYYHLHYCTSRKDIFKEVVLR